MSQDNLSANEDRAKPRFQAPPVTGTSAKSNTGAPNSSPASQPVINPATSQKQPAPDPVRPTDWPAPDAPATNPAFGPNYGAYQVPPVNSNYDWSKMSTEPKSGNLYRYEDYTSAPYTPMPAQPLDPQAEAYRQASRRVRAKLDFQKQLWAYLLVNGLLWIIYFLTVNWSHPTFWPIWSTVFWGIGLLAQWWNLSGRDAERQKRMVEEEMRRRNQY